MRKTPATTMAGAVTLVALGALTTLALRPAVKAAPPAPPVEVRTQVMRRTVWIVKHEKPTHPHRSRTPAATAPPRPHASGIATTPTTPVADAAVAGAPRTSTSRARATTSQPSVTPAPGSAQPVSAPGPTAAPVTTHTSGSSAGVTTSSAQAPAAAHTPTGSAPAATKPPATRTSGASPKTGTGVATGTPSSPTAKPVTTRTSGKGGEKGDSHDD